MRVCGIMSGTSLDGISLAVVEFQKSGWTLREHRDVPYSKATRAGLLAISNAPTHTAEIARWNFRLAELYAKAVAKLSTPLDLIGCHGQTVFHEPGCTLQLGEAQVLAERTGVPVVSNFRPRDIAAGGQGAPLVPFVDDLLFRHHKLTRVALNIGGIANVTILAPGAETIAFDTGPGNMIVDQLAWAASKGKLTYDRGAKLARQGTVHRGLLADLLRAPYFAQKPPKSCGREQYGREFVATLLATQLPLADLLATATVFTAASIALAVPEATDELIAAGGGTRNPMIMAHLAALLPRTRATTTAEWGIPVMAKEAVAFAMLARQTWLRQPGNLPSATGARRPVVLGQITP
jgi:anhydro-N-acetylmuramic acid kinase